ncbi:uncharacterized protein [Cicer arietinum]|uniref:Inactive protein RESTRICTED TEV MOVEMENT 2 n=1 Tax=Cicer arietinum TaxID=3827 RepID=A0A1S2Y5D8_CICAR|nr:inactive protein RESTRICTED TEV MOVEMENT 2 [Cicer arietinum]
MSTLQSSYIYKDLQPKIEIKDTPESHLLLVHIPDGFERGDIGARVEYDFGRVRVFGEKSIGSNKMIRFIEKYQVPSHCDIGKIKGKFDGKIVTITMPKIPGKVQEQEPIKDYNNVDEVNDKKDEVTNVENKEDATSQEAQKGQKENSQITKVDSKGEANYVASTSQESTQESIPQQGQQEISQNESISQKGQATISENESIPQKGQDEISQKESMTENDQEEISQKESIPQNDQKETSQNSKLKKVESKEKAYDETSTPSEATQGEEGIHNKATDTKDAKLQTEENSSSLKDENKEKQRVVKEETKETKEESKELAIVKTFPPKKTNKEKGKEMINDKFGGDDADEKKSDKKGIHESTRTRRLKDMALSTTQAVTSFAKRFNEDDKQMLIYTGATILVVALGVYASYKYRSSRRT